MIFVISIYKIRHLPLQMIFKNPISEKLIK